MVTIPRYNQSLDLTPIRSGRTLATGLSATSGFADLGTSLSKNLNNLAETKINLLAQSRDLDIKNDELLAATNTTEVTLNFVDELTKKGDYKNNEKLYNKTWDNTLSKLKKDIFKNEDGSLDSISYENYMTQQGNMLYLDGLNKVKELTNKQRINRTNLAIGKSTVAAINNINSNNYIEQKKELYNIAIIEIDNLSNILPADVILNLRENLFDQTNSTFIDSQLRGNDVYINPLGEQQPDYNTIYENLQNPKTYEGDKKLTNINGNEITYNSPEQKELLESTLNRLKQQDYSNSVRINKNNNKIMLDVIPRIYNIDITLKEIKNLSFSNDVAGQELKRELIDTYNLVSQGDLPNQNDTFLTNNIFGKVANLKISNHYGKSWWPEKGEDNYQLMIDRLKQKLGNDFERFKETKMSIGDMVNKGIINRETYTQILKSQENPLSIRIQQDFERALAAYEPVVKGNPTIATLDQGASTIRLYEYGIFMKNLFYKEFYDNGKNPDDLLNPSSDSYIFNKKNLSQFILTPEQQINTIGVSVFTLNAENNKNTLIINGVEYEVNGTIPNKAEWERNNDGNFLDSEEYRLFKKNNPELIEALRKAETKTETETETETIEEQIAALSKQQKRVFYNQIQVYKNSVENNGQEYADKYIRLTELQIQYLESIKEK
jgi:hypothetical protein